MSKVYLQMTIKLKPGGYDRFCEAFAQHLPEVEKVGGRKLVGAWVTLCGQANTVIHLWEHPDMAAYGEFMDVKNFKAIRTAQAFAAVCAEVIQDQSTALFTKAPYSP